jgi:hypothetical protein
VTVAPLRRIALLLRLWAVLAGAVWGWGVAADPADLCDRAAADAARATGVPLAVLQAIALTETGRNRGGQLRPWPWATNQGGPGHWFETRAAAEAHVRALVAEGRRNIDIGCFQINLRWHGHAFAGPEAMFDPAANAHYAARFLAGLAAELGSWEAAAGAYHSRTPELAERYGARFRQHLAALGAGPLAPVPQAVPEWEALPVAAASGRPERAPPSPYPLLTAGPPAGLGSLVPVGGVRGTLVVAAARPLQ